MKDTGLSGDEIAELWRRFEKAPAPRLARLPLPRRTRLRLAVTRTVDLAAIWLIDHVHWRAGEWLWRATGLWDIRTRRGKPA